MDAIERLKDLNKRQKKIGALVFSASAPLLAGDLWLAYNTDDMAITVVGASVFGITTALGGVFYLIGVDGARTVRKIEER